MTVESTTSGIARNPFTILDAVDYMGEDGYVEYNENARDNNVVKASGHDRVLFDTGYFELNELVGLHQVAVRWWMAVTQLNVRYYWIKPDGNEEYYDLTVTGTDDPDYGFGIVGNYYFEENYQYRIQIRSIVEEDHADVAEVYLDYVTLTPLNIRNVQTNIEVPGLNEYYLGGGTTTIGNYVQVERFGKETVSGTNNTAVNKRVYLNSTPAHYVATATMKANSTNYRLCTIISEDPSSFIVQVYKVTLDAWVGDCQINWKATCLEEYTVLNDDLVADPGGA